MSEWEKYFNRNRYEAQAAGTDRCEIQSWFHLHHLKILGLVLTLSFIFLIWEMKVIIIST